MESRRRSLQKRRIQSDYVSKASPLKISFTPSVTECSISSTEYQNETAEPRSEELEPPEIARRHSSDTNEIYPSASRDTLESFLNIDSTAHQFSMVPLPSSPNWQHSVNSFNTILDHAPAIGTQTELQTVDNEMDMSISSSTMSNVTPHLGDLTPPPSQDRTRSQKSAFVRAGQVYESFQIGMETPETPADLPMRPDVPENNALQFKRRRMSMDNLESIDEPTITPRLHLAQTADVVAIQENEHMVDLESMNELEDDLANTSLIEAAQIDTTMQQDHGEKQTEVSLSNERVQQLESVHAGASVNVPRSSEPILRREYTRPSAKDSPPAVNEMTVIASVVGEVILETLKSTTTDTEARAAVKLFKKQAETIFVEQMNLWSENEALQKDRRSEMNQGKRLRAKLLEVRTRRQAIQAEIEHERSLYQSVEHDTKESQGLQDLLDGIQYLKAKAKESEPGPSDDANDKHRATLQGVVKSLTSRCGVIDESGNRQGGLLQLLRDFNDKLELWNSHLEDEQMRA